MNGKNQEPMDGTEAIYKPMDLPTFVERWHLFATPTVPSKDLVKQDAFALWQGKKALADLDRAGLRDRLFLDGGVGQLSELPAWKLGPFVELNQYSNFYREAASNAARLRSRYLGIRDALSSAQSKIRKANASIQNGRLRKFADRVVASLDSMKVEAEAAPRWFWYLDLESSGDLFNRGEPNLIPARSQDLDGVYQRRVFRVLYAHLQPPVLSAPDVPALTIRRLVLLTYLGAGLAEVKEHHHLSLTFSGPSRSGKTASELTLEHIARNLRKVIIPECAGEPDLISPP